MGRTQLFVFLLTIPLCMGEEIYYDFTVSRYIADPDGVAKEVIGINGQSPGPVIRVCQGDVVTVRVSNQLDRGEATSIHWHGILQTWNNINDGVSWITQYPIPPGTTYTYRFRAEHTGTYWYHSHHKEQWTDGLYGVIIIEDPPEVPQPYDAELLLILAENSHVSSPVIYTWFSAQTTFRHLPLSDSLVFNGRGGYPCEYSNRLGLLCEPMDQVKYAQVRVRPGLSYRIRVLNACTNFGYIVQIDNHSFRILETDGVPSKADRVFEKFYIDSAQRISLLVKMDQTTESQFWIRFNAADNTLTDFGLTQPNLNKFPAVSHKILDQSKIVLKYDFHADLNCKDDNALEVAYPPYPTTRFKKIDTLANDKNVFPADSQPLIPSHVNESHNLLITDILGVKDGGSGFNYVKMDLRSVNEPALFVVARGERLPPQFNAIYVNGFGPDYVVEVILNNVAATGHPIHLHGHNMWLAGQGNTSDGLFVEDKWRSQLKVGEKTAYRDTLGIALDSWTVLRFVANNPGVWLLHCHSEMHLATGMGFVFVVGEKEIQRQFQGRKSFRWRKELPQSNLPLMR